MVDEVVFFSVSSIKLSLISFSVITALLVAIGYFGIFINIVNGIKGSGYSVTSKHVYYDGKLIYNAKATGSTILNGVILKSDNKVFFKNEEIVDADHDSFEYLADYYSKDNKRIYQNKTPILPNANAKTFTLVNDKGRVTYGVDNQYVYIMQGVGVEKRLESFHPDTVQFLVEDYIMDRGTIYYVDSSEEKMSSLAVDTATFNVTGFNWEAQTDAKDKNNLYFHGKIVSAIGTTGGK